MIVGEDGAAKEPTLKGALSFTRTRSGSASDLVWYGFPCQSRYPPSCHYWVSSRFCASAAGVTRRTVGV